MKKKLLATGVAVALGALSGLASAAVEVQANNVGQINILPYYSVQEGNDTLISITNTDTVNGKAVKVRFRGAQWSDDVFDFQVFLSPGDVWTGAVTKEGNLAKLSTSDTSCTLPANVNQAFVPQRLQAGSKDTGTLEGYVEIITMANIPNLAGSADGLASYWSTTNAATHTLYNAIKHPANGQPACRTVAAAQQFLEALIPDYPGAAAGNHQATSMTAVTGSLASYATIINVPSSKAFTVTATALTDEGAAQKYYFQQASNVLAWSNALTEDRIFATLGVENGAAVPMYQFDMPDLSTPTGTVATAALQRAALVAELARANVRTEYVTTDSLLASTDVVIAQPVRRYFYEYAVQAVPANAHLTLPDSTSATKTFTVAASVAPYAGLTQLGRNNTIEVGGATFYDREENRTTSNNIVISPTPPSANLYLEGEVSVISLNNSSIPTGALNASITAQDYTVTGGYANGWATLSTTNQAGGTALPVIGFTAINLFNASAGSAGTNYGMVLPLK